MDESVVLPIDFFKSFVQAYVWLILLVTQMLIGLLNLLIASLQVSLVWFTCNIRSLFIRALWVWTIDKKQILFAFNIFSWTQLHVMFWLRRVGLLVICYIDDLHLKSDLFFRGFPKLKLCFFERGRGGIGAIIWKVVDHFARPNFPKPRGQTNKRHGSDNNLWW